MSHDIESQIIEAEENLRRAMLASDVGALDKLLAPGLIFTNHFGQCQGKEEDLAAHESGFLSISQLDTSEQQIKLVGESVVVVSVRVQIAGEYAGQPAGGDFRFTRVWAMGVHGGWQVVAAHSGRIA